MVAVLAVALVAWALAYSEVTFRWQVPRVVRARRRPVDLAAYLAEVAARLRAGSSEADAWTRTTERQLGVESAPQAEASVAALDAFGSGNVEAVRGARASALLARELGAPLADLLDHYGQILVQTQAADDAMKVALAGPRASARLLAALPFVGLLIGAAMGADPLGSLAGSGGLPIVVGGILIAVGHAWTRSLIARAGHGNGIGEAIDAHLLAGALETGAAIPRALAAVGAVGERPELVEAGGLLTLGADWDEAWAPPHLGRGTDPSELPLVARVLEPAWRDGANPVPLLTGAAARVLARSDRAAREAAERLSIRLVVPLGLCFLPAFILIGVVPIVISLGVSLT